MGGFVGAIVATYIHRAEHQAAIARHYWGAAYGTEMRLLILIKSERRCGADTLPEYSWKCRWLMAYQILVSLKTLFQEA